MEKCIEVIGTLTKWKMHTPFFLEKCFITDYYVTGFLLSLLLKYIGAAIHVLVF